MHTLDFPISTQFSTLLDDLVARLGPSFHVQKHVIALFATSKGPAAVWSILSYHSIFLF